MNRVNIRELETYICTPGASLYLAHHPQVALSSVFRDLCRDAAEAAIRANYADLAEKLCVLPESAAIDTNSVTTAFFVNKYMSWSYQLAYDIHDQFYVQQGLVTAPIERHLYRLDRYWVMVIFHGVPHLFEGYATHINKVHHPYMTMEGKQQFMLDDIAGLVCHPSVGESWGKRCRYRSGDEFITALDSMLVHILEYDPLPVICIGDTQSLSWFGQYSQFRDGCVGTVVVDEHLSPVQLYNRAFPLMNTWLSKQRKQVLGELQQALRARLCIRQISDIWHYLHDDSVRLIALDRTLRMPGCEDREASSVSLGSICHGTEPIDAIDSLLMTAHRRAIPVILFDKDELEQFQGVAALVTGGQES